MVMCVFLLSLMLHVKCLCVVLLSQMSLNVYVLNVLLHAVVQMSHYLRCYMLNVYVCCPVISDVTC